MSYRLINFEKGNSITKTWPFVFKLGIKQEFHRIWLKKQDNSVKYLQELMHESERILYIKFACTYMHLD